MKNNVLKITLLALLTLAGFSACKDKDEAPTEQENITTIVVDIRAADGSLVAEYEWNDLDGPGGNDPEIDTIVLDAGKTYSCDIHVYDRSRTPDVDITLEIEAESTEHLFVYAVAAADVAITALDTDADGKPFRLVTQWVTGAVSSGSVNIQLKHEPDKDAADPDATGDTDFDVTFPVRVQ